MIKSNIAENKKVSPRYPHLGIYGPTGLVVLFSGPNIGTCVVGGDDSDHRVGEHSEEWTESVFERLDGVVELRND